MRDLIRQILKEEEETYDTLEMIRDYSGGNNFLNDVERKLRIKNPESWRFLFLLQ